MVVRPDRHALRAPAELAAQRFQSLHDAVVEAAHSGAQRSLRQRHFTMASTEAIQWSEAVIHRLNYLCANFAKETDHFKMALLSSNI